MNKKEYLKTFKKITEEMYNLTERKNNDYAGKEDPFKNFRFCEQFGICSVENGILVRITDKLSRVINLLKGVEQKVIDEKVEDTLKDLAVYSIILLTYLKSKKGAK